MIVHALALIGETGFDDGCISRRIVVMINHINQHYWVLTRELIPTDNHRRCGVFTPHRPKFLGGAVGQVAYQKQNHDYQIFKKDFQHSSAFFATLLAI